jgi:hypothetical protein
MSTQRTRFDVTWDQYRNSDPKQGDCTKTTLLGLATNVEGLAGISYQFEWGAAVPAATFGFQISNKKSPVFTTSADWTALSSTMITNYSAINVSGVGTAGNSVVMLGSLHAAWVRPTVTIATAATAAASVYCYGCANAQGA